MMVGISECVTLTNTGRSIQLGRVDFIFLFSFRNFLCFPPEAEGMFLFTRIQAQEQES